MILTWIELARQYVVKYESTGRRPSLGGIKEAINKDEDYLLCIPCPRGEIYRYDNVGEFWAVYVNSPGSKKRRSIWSKLDALGCEQVQTGDIEATWKFEAEKLSQVAEILKVHKRYKRKNT